MSFKDQFKKIKENWFLIVLLIAALIGFNLIPVAFQSISYGNIESAQFKSIGSTGIMPPSFSEDFAPEVKDRIITKTTSLSTEVNQGTFNDAQTKLKSIISSTNSYLLNENVNKYGSEKKSYYEASYSIKVDSNKHNELITLLKDIGEVKNFNENTEDITGSYTNIKIELEAEKERLLRYKALYQDSQNIQDKLQLSDKIFDQERRIKYLEDVINSLDKDVEYSTIYLTIREKQSEYVNITLVRFSQLIKNLVNSFNTLLNLIFVLLPYTILFLAIFFIIKLIKRK